MQLIAALAGFTITILLLESEALLSWAERLDVGPARHSAMEVTSVIHRALSPLGIEQVRRMSLTGLDRLGYSDDPARLEEARLQVSSASSHPCPASIATKIGLPRVAPVMARGTSTPVSTGVPAKTSLVQLQPTSAGQPRVVALVGDSMMAVGLSNILLRQSANNQNLRVVKAFRSGTGLARPDVFDWTSEYPAMIGNDHPDAVIVAIGANDGQGFVEDGKVLPFGTDAWVKVYQQRTAAFLDLLTQDGAHVVWVGLPPMQSAQYNQKIEEINRIAYTVVSQYPQATWWNPAPFIGDDTGRFREFGAMADGKTTRLRAPDGIHLSDEGASLLTPTLFTWLNAPPPSHTAALATPAATKSKSEAIRQ